MLSFTISKERKKYNDKMENGENMSKSLIKIGVICSTLEGERIDLAEQFLHNARKTLAVHGLEIVNKDSSYTLTGEEVLIQSKQCEALGAEAIIYLIGTWILADHIIDAVQRINLPIGLWGIPEPASFSSVGTNVLHGAFDEMNIKHKLFYGHADDNSIAKEIVVFARACQLKKKCMGARLGLLGGRTISAYPTSADANQIKEMFGIEVEHIDQLVLLEKARAIPLEQSKEVIQIVRDRYGKVDVPEEILIKSANVYLALKEIQKEYKLDFCSVKCLGEFINTYTSCCLAVSMLNDEGIVTGCQCSINATISSYLLSQLSDDPAYFGDINVVLKEEGIARLINCGAIPGKLATDNKDINIVTQYEYMGTGRGACTLFCCKPGKITFGTLGRVHGKYVMSIAGGEAFTEPKEKLTEVRNWAQGFVKLDCDPMEFYNNIRSNHSTACYGDFKEELVEFCRLTGVQVILN